MEISGKDFQPHGISVATCTCSKDSGVELWSSVSLQFSLGFRSSDVGNSKICEWTQSERLDEHRGKARFANRTRTSIVCRLLVVQLLALRAKHEQPCGVYFCLVFQVCHLPTPLVSLLLRVSEHWLDLSTVSTLWECGGRRPPLGRRPHPKVS